MMEWHHSYRKGFKVGFDSPNSQFAQEEPIMGICDENKFLVCDENKFLERFDAPGSSTCSPVHDLLQIACLSLPRHGGVENMLVDSLREALERWEQAEAFFGVEHKVTMQAKNICRAWALQEHKCLTDRIKGNLDTEEHRVEHFKERTILSNRSEKERRILARKEEELPEVITFLNGRNTFVGWQQKPNGDIEAVRYRFADVNVEEK